MTQAPGDNGERAVLLGIAATILAGSLIAGMDAVAKSLMDRFEPMQVVWARYLFHALLTAIALGYKGNWGFLLPRKPKLQGLRAGCLLITTLAMYTAIQTVPLADAAAVLFFAPVLVTALAGLILGELVGPWRKGAVVVGFLGVLLIVRPGVGAFDPMILFAVIGAVSLAFYYLLTRKLRGLDDERATLFHGTAMGAVVLTLALPLWFSAPNAVEWFWLISIGVLGAVGHFLLVKAFSLAPASVLSPFLNAQLVASAIYSVVFFHDPLTPTFVVGATLIMGAGLFIWMRERRKAMAK